ncbi:MAG: hypothetical protein ACRDNE_01000 [Gaiellaceae bacterium]
MDGALIALVALACPIGMGLMMWFMAKGMRGEKPAEQRRADQASLVELQAEHARLAAQIERLEGTNGVGERDLTAARDRG